MKAIAQVQESQGREGGLAPALSGRLEQRSGIERK